MKTFVALATLLSLAQSIVALTINTPTNVVSCQPTLLTWSDGQAPFFLSIIPGGQVSAPALKTFPTQNGNSMTWVVDLQPNTGITFSLKDSTGQQAYSDIVTITGTDTSCANASSSPDANSSAAPATNSANSPASSGTAPVAGATTSAGPVHTTAANSNAPSSSKTSAASATGTNANAAASSTSTNAATKSDARILGVAGVMALVGLVVA